MKEFMKILRTNCCLKWNFAALDIKYAEDSKTYSSISWKMFFRILDPQIPVSRLLDYISQYSQKQLAWPSPACQPIPIKSQQGPSNPSWSKGYSWIHILCVMCLSYKDKASNYKFDFFNNHWLDLTQIWNLS